ncbi:MAG: VWA domain-containing protein, partial [Bryobacteraceae bacterium]
PQLLAILFLAAPLWAADREQPPAQGLFHVNTRLVEVDVVVRNKSGPVGGLTKNDFTVLDRGKPQKIAVFNVLTAGRSAPEASPLPEGAVSNRLNSHGEEPAGATVVLWDKLNTDTQDQSYVRGQVLKYLRTLQQGDGIALYTLVKALRVVQDFTGDPGALIRAVEKLGPEQSANLTAADLTDLASQIDNPLLQALGGAGLSAVQTMAENTAAEMTDYSLRDRAWVTANSLAAIAGHLGGLPGRKKLIWISGSFPGVTLNQRSRVGATQIEVQDFGPYINAAIRKLNEANVAVYPIDPRGVTTGMNAKTGALTPGSSGLMDPSIDTMQLLAHGTGGRPFYAVNDLAGAVGEAMDDDRITYVLGFYPSDEKLDGSYHPISVKVAKKGIEARHRDGYYSPDPRLATPGNRREALNDVFGNPLDATQLGLLAQLIPVAGVPREYELRLTLNANELHFDRVKDRWVALISYATLFAPSESTKGTLEQIRLSLTQDRLRAALQGGYAIRRKIQMDGTGGELRIVVQD